MKKFLIIISILFLSAGVQAKNFWELQTKPAKGTEESIGTYSLGCMIGAKELPLDGYGYQVMRPSRERFFARAEMVDYIENLGKDVRNKLKSTLMVGDMSLPKGGPFSFGHRSHQNGLDADIWFYTPPAANKRSLSRVEREKISAQSLVNQRKKLLNENWKAYHRNLIKLAASKPEVDRVFVNPVIKRELCKLDNGADWLGKVRPWSEHDDHMHVRLKCPDGDNHCKYPEGYETIKGDGCDDTLAWWFRKPTRQEIADWLKKKALEKKKPKPKLPLKCQQLSKRK